MSTERIHARVQTSQQGQPLPLTERYGQIRTAGTPPVRRLCPSRHRALTVSCPMLPPQKHLVQLEEACYRVLQEQQATDEEGNRAELEDVQVGGRHQCWKLEVKPGRLSAARVVEGRVDTVGHLARKRAG